MTRGEETGRKRLGLAGAGKAMEEVKEEKRKERREWESLGTEKEQVRAWRLQPTSQWVTSSWRVISQSVSQHSVAIHSH